MTIQPPAPPSASSSSSASSTALRTELLTNLTTQTALLTKLFQSLSAPISTTAPTASGTTFPTAAGTNPGANIPQLYAALQQSTSALQSQTEALWAHQRAWREMKRQEAEVRDLEGRVRGLVWELESGRAELEGLVQEGAGVRATIERLESGALARVLAAVLRQTGKELEEADSSANPRQDPARARAQPRKLHVRAARTRRGALCAAPPQVHDPVAGRDGHARGDTVHGGRDDGARGRRGAAGVRRGGA